MKRRSFIGLAAAAALGTAAMPETLLQSARNGIWNEIPVTPWYRLPELQPLQRSIWFVHWGQQKTFILYPKAADMCSTVMREALDEETP